MCCRALLQGIYPTQESNLGLLQCRWILYRLCYKGSPVIKLKKTKYPVGDPRMENPGMENS